MNASGNQNKYDNKKPTISALIDRLDEHIQKSTSSYELSKEEAQLISNSIKTLSTDCLNHSDDSLVYYPPISDDATDWTVPKDFKLKLITSSISGKPFRPSYYDMAQMYLDGKEVAEIAKAFNVTRTRVWMCLAKARRISLGLSEHKLAE
jgi:hypothetical protein